MPREFEVRKPDCLSETRVTDFKRKLIEPALIEAKGEFEVAAAKLNMTSRNLRRLVRVLNVKLL